MSDYQSSLPGGLINAMGSNLVPDGTPPQPRGVSNPGTQRSTPDGQGQQIDFMRSTVDPSQGIPAGGPITGVRDADYGSPKLLSEATMEDIVNVAGIGEMTLRSALHAGFVKDGDYSDSPRQAPGEGAAARVSGDDQEPQEQEVHPDLAVERMDDAAETALSELLDGTDRLTAVAAAQELASGAEDFSDAHVESMASQLGVEPDVVREKAARVRAGFTKQAEATVAKELGPIFDAEDFWGWAWQNQPNAMREAVMAQVNQGTTSEYRKIASAYLDNLDRHDPHAILNADFGPGVTAKRMGDDVVIIANGTPMGRFADLLRAGMIKVSKRA